MSDNKLLHGDCLKLLDTLPESSIDMICGDLPYGTTKCSWDTPIDLDQLWPKLKRVAKDNAAILMFAQTPFDKVLGVSNLPMLRYEWIWEKTSATGFFNAEKMPMKAHENILVFYKNLPTYNPIKTTNHLKKSAGRHSQNSECYGKAVKKTQYDSTDRFPRSVITFVKDTYTDHPTQKPVQLLEYLIRTYSNTGETVLDFCMGSGTTGVACELSGREFIGMEKTLKHFKAAKQRINDSSRQSRMFA